MKLDINLRKQTTADNLPNEPKDKMLAGEIRRSNVDNRAADSFSGGDNDVVVLGDLKGVQRFPRLRFIQHARIDRVGNRVVDQLGEDQTVFALIKELHSIGGDGVSLGDIWIVFDDL